MSTIKVGDRVTYRPKSDRPDFMPMALSGCEVEAITEDGYAKLNWQYGNCLENFYAPLDCITKEKPCRSVRPSYEFVLGRTAFTSISAVEKKQRKG